MRGTHQGQQSARTAPTGRTHDCKRPLHHHAQHDLLQSGGDPHMTRRRFLAVLGVAVVAAPIAALAQQSTGIPRIGVLMGASESLEAPRLATFRGALEKLGYVDGQTVVIEPRYVEGMPDRFGSLARDLVALAPSVIASVGRQETVALQAATRTIPIVFMQVNDPVQQGLVATLARLGGNITGFSQMSAELDPKRLELLHEIAPSVSRAAFLVNPTLTPRLGERVAGAEGYPTVADRRLCCSTPSADGI